MKHSNITVSSSKLQFAEPIKGALLYTFRCTVRASLASPFGRGGRAQRGRRGQTMTIPKDNTQLENARRLRREMTPHERKLWYLFLRKYPVKIYKQRIIGRFIVDFYCASARKAARPSQSPAVTALPRGEPRVCTLYIVCCIRNGACLYRYAPLAVL